MAGDFHSPTLQEALKQYNRLLDDSDSPISLLLQFLVPFEADGFGDLPLHDMAYHVLAAPVVLLLKVPCLCVCVCV